MKFRRVIGIVAGAAVLLIVVNAITGGCLSFYVRILLHTALPGHFLSGKWEAAAKAYAAGELIEQEGVVALPADLAGTTIDGRMYVTKNHAWGDLFLFVTWRGKGSNLRGYLLCRPNGGGSVGTGQGTTEIIGPTILSGRRSEKIEVEIVGSPPPDGMRYTEVMIR